MSNGYVGFDNAPVVERLPGWEVGTYIAKVVSLSKFTSVTKGGDYFKAAFEIMQASPGSNLKVGDNIAEVLPLFGAWRLTFYGKAKNLIGACGNVPGRLIKEKDFLEAVDEDKNPCAGSLVKVTVIEASKKHTQGQKYPQASYAPVPAAVSPDANGVTATAVAEAT